MRSIFPGAEIHGVVSFYHDYRREAPARHVVKICRAEACQAVGSEELAAKVEEVFQVKTGAASDDRRIGIEAVYCLGNVPWVLRRWSTVRSMAG